MPRGFASYDYTGNRASKEIVMENNKEPINGMIFNEYPVPLEKVSQYIRQRSQEVKVKGYFLTKSVLKIIFAIVKNLSWSAAYRMGKWLGELFYYFRVRRKVAMINLDIVYGDKKSFSEKESIYKASLINFGRFIINYMRLPYQDASFWRTNCEIKGEKNLQDALNKKKGALLLSGHIGMMDLAGGKLGMSGYPGAVIGKRIRHPIFDQVSVQTRNSMNFGTIKQRDSMKRILDGIRSGEVIAMALDQNIKRSVGVFVNWMGREASSVRSAAYVARETGAPALAGYMFQKGPDKFELVLTEEVPWESFPQDPEKELLINTQKQSDAIQKIVYEHPELWFWIHQRWKTQPGGVKSPYV